MTEVARFWLGSGRAGAGHAAGIPTHVVTGARAAKRRSGARLRGLAIRSLVPVLALAAGVGCAGLSPEEVGSLVGAILAPEATAQSLSPDTIARGLREALEVGTRNATLRTSQTDGFFANDAIHIPIPDELGPMAAGLRTIGLGPQVDRFELTMNRAAERAAGEALSVFATSIRQMTFDDARRILDGPDDAATRFFRRTAGVTLERRFEPIVRDGMQQVGLVRTYEDLLARWRAVPLAPQPTLDLTDYVTGRALDGLFFVVAEEEKKIREDPAARVTELLRRVFGAS